MQAQTELPRKHAAAQVSDCRECLSLLLLLEDSGNDTCMWWERAKGLKEEVERPRSIRECKGEIAW